MMPTNVFPNLIWFSRLLCIVFLSGIMFACTTIKKPPEIAYIETTTIPSKLAVMPTVFAPEEKNKNTDFAVDGKSEKGKFIADLARGVVHNQLTGKGFDMLILSQADSKLKGVDVIQTPAGEICEKLGVQGLVYIGVTKATMVTGVAYDLYKIDAKIKMVDRNGKELGTWEDSASKRKIAIPTSPIGVATTIAGAFLNESARKQMRLVIYDWGWKVTQFVPDSPLGKTMPEVVSVDSNIDKGVFAAGDRIMVEVVAEKGLTCNFDMGEFKKALTMSDDGSGTYKGSYVVQEGDRISNQPLSIHLFRSNGVERVWHETGGMVTIDGVLPPGPDNIEAQAGKKGISLVWSLPQGEELETFVVEKSQTPVGGYEEISKTKDLKYLDTEVSQGKTYYYRVRSVDLAGNRSAKTITANAVMPNYDEVSMTGALSGTLVSGVYRIKGEAVIARGDVLTIGKGAKIMMEPDAHIVVNGILKVNGTSHHPAVFQGEKWKGIDVSDRGEADFSSAIVRGCALCINIDGGSVRMSEVSIKGRQEDGIVVRQDGVLAMNDVEVNDCERALVIESGRATIEKSTLTRNTIGMDISGGTFALGQSNIYGNKDKDIRSQRKIVLESNYLGAATAKELNLEGDILVKSLLDAPFPHGRKIVLVDTTEISPEVLEERFQTSKKAGISAFKEQRYGDAHQLLSKALKMKEDKEIYLYLAYTQSSLGENENMIGTLDRGIQTFPYEVRLYQIYVKHLAASGKKNKAQTLLEHAIKLNPQDQNLVFLKQYIDTLE